MGKKQTDKTRGKEESQKHCVHHWIIDPPNETESKGVCKKCGATRRFSNNSSIDFRDSLLLSTKKRMGNSKRES